MVKKMTAAVPAYVVERNIQLTGEVMRYLLNQPLTFNALPDHFELVILPDDDPELRQYNLDLLDKYGSEGKPIVFARLKTHAAQTLTPALPDLFVPLAKAA